MIFLTHQHYFDYSKGQNLSQIEHENSAQSAGFLSDWLEEFSKSIENNIPSIIEKSIDAMSNRNKNII